MYFDPNMTAAVRRAWSHIEAAGLSCEMPEVGWKPHITLSGCYNLPLDTYLPALQNFAGQTKPLDITLASVGYFGGGELHTLFLLSAVTIELLNLHERHHHLLTTHCAAVSPYYVPNQWIPHCTLAVNLPAEALAQAVKLPNGFGLPIKGRLEAIGIVRVTRPQVQEVVFMPLG